MKKIITLFLLLAAMKISYGKCSITQEITNVTLGAGISYIAGPNDTAGPFYFNPGESIMLAFTVTGSSICVLSNVTWTSDSGTLPYYFSNNNSTTYCYVSDPGVYKVDVGMPYYFKIENHPASVSEFASAMPVSIFPNPVSEKVIIHFNQSLPRTITLVSATGEILFQSASNNAELSFDAAHLRKGIYFVKVLEGEKVAMKKMIKM